MADELIESDEELAGYEVKFWCLKLENNFVSIKICMFYGGQRV